MSPQPRALLTWTAVAMVVALITTNPFHRALVLLAAANVVLAVRRRDARLRPLLLMCATAGFVSLLISGLLSHSGTHVLANLPTAVPGLGGPITLEALAFGASSAIGLGTALLAASPLMLAVDADQVLDAAPRHLERTAATVAGALAMLPRFGRNVGDIHEAQRLRGLSDSRIRRARHVLLPAVLTAVEDSVQVAAAMDARGFGSGPRTRLRAHRHSARDRWVVGLTVAALVVAIGARLGDGLADWYPFPTLTLPRLDPASIVCALLLLAPALLWKRA